MTYMWSTYVVLYFALGFPYLINDLVWFSFPWSFSCVHYNPDGRLAGVLSYKRIMCMSTIDAYETQMH